MSGEAVQDETATDAAETGGSRAVGLHLLSAAVAVLVSLPLIWLFLAVTQVGFSRLVSLMTRDTTVTVLRNSLVLVAMVTVACVLIGVPLAWLTVRSDLPFPRFWTVAVTLPLVIPSYIGAFAYHWTFRPNGEFQSFLDGFGLGFVPEVTGLEGTVLVLTLYTYPYVYITTRAALKTLDTTLVDAARTLRHDRLSAFRRVVVPQIRPAAAAGSLLVALYALSDFGTPRIMTYQVFTNVIYTEQKAVIGGTPGLDRLLSLQLLAVTVVILAVESRLRGDEKLHSGRQGGHVGDTVRLGRWRWVAMLFPATVVVMALGVPLGVFGNWYLTATETIGYSVPFKMQYALNSITVSTAAAIVAAAAGLPVAYLSARRSSRLAGVFERVTYLGYAIPGVVLGLSLTFLATQPVVLGPHTLDLGVTAVTVGPHELSFVEFYQALPLLVFAYLVRFLPQSVGSTRASFLQVNPALPEAARTLGRSSLSAFRSVTLPLIAPGLLGGAALVFLTTMKELPATLILRPTGYKTVVLHIWQAYNSGAYGDAVVPAAILLCVSGLSILVILSQEGYDVK